MSAVYKKIWLVIAVTGLVFSVPALMLSPFFKTLNTASPERAKTAGAQALQAQYMEWKNTLKKTNHSSEVQMVLGWSKALSLSKKPGKAHGLLKLNMENGLVSATVDGLPKTSPGMDLWLVDNIETTGSSVKPEASDHSIKVGQFVWDGGHYLIDAKVPELLDRHFQMDIAVVTPAGIPPYQEGLLFASGDLFQRKYMHDKLGGSDVVALPGKLASILGINPAQAESPLDSMDALISTGADLFFNGKFNGNGRSCGTCHPATNNFTIDPEFIATLPANDPLFVAENIPALSKNFEIPALMRRLGLIRENLDGFDDLDNKYVMRSVPHVLALSTSIEPAPAGMDGTTIPPEQRTGWGGDGAPGSGTLRDFATGAVVQHYTLRPERVAGIDFRLPTDAELDAIEAFLLALGRQQDLDLSTLVLSDPIAENGKEVFMKTDTESGTVDAGKCVMCHLNAGASSIFAPGANFNFDTGVERIPVKLASLVAPGQVPADGGFGLADSIAINGGFGDGTFSAPPLVEAADTPPFFHNSAAATLEEAIAFYLSDAFDTSPRGQFLASLDSGGLGIKLDPSSTQSIAAFLRVINALENIRSSKDTGLSAQVASSASKAALLLDVMQSDVEDAIDDLTAQNLNLDAALHIVTARDQIIDAKTASDAQPTQLVCFFFFCKRETIDSPSDQDTLISQAIAELDTAKSMMSN